LSPFTGSSEAHYAFCIYSRTDSGSMTSFKTFVPLGPLLMTPLGPVTIFQSSVTLFMPFPN